ncbi:MAG: type II secretion system protein GspL [Sphingomonas sp.]
MSAVHLVFLPASGADWRWLRIENHAVVARGNGAPPVDATVPLIAIAPAEAMALHWARLPDRSAAQATAAARLIVAELSAAPIETLHVAVGQADDAEGAEQPVAVITQACMRALLAGLADAGIEPAAVLPAALLIAAPASGFVCADFGTERVVRGAARAFADDPVLTPLLTGGEVPEPLDHTALEAAIVSAVARRPLDLLQGPFVRKQRLMPDWARLRQLALLAAGIVAVTLAITLVQVLRYNLAADALEQKTDQLARAGLPKGESVNNAAVQLTDRMARLRGAGIGFSRASASVFQALAAVPGTELRMLSFDANGDVRLTLVTQTQGQIIDVKSQLEGMGFVVRPTPFSASNGRFAGDFTVSKP